MASSIAHLVLFTISKCVCALSLELVVLKAALVCGPACKDELALPMHLIVYPITHVAVAATYQLACSSNRYCWWLHRSMQLGQHTSCCAVIAWQQFQGLRKMWCCCCMYAVALFPKSSN